MVRNNNLHCVSKNDTRLLVNFSKWRQTFEIILLADSEENYLYESMVEISTLPQLHCYQRWTCQGAVGVNPQET